MFFKYSRMDHETFQDLLKLVKPFLEKFSIRTPLAPELRLMVTLRYLASGDQVSSLAFAYRIGISTCNQIIKESSGVISEVLTPLYLACPDEEKWKSISSQFLYKWNMPSCIGALDGKHVQVQAPPNCGSDYFNYKKHFNIVLLALCDANYKFSLVGVGSPGSNEDSSIFLSHLGLSIENNQLNIPRGLAQLPGENIMLPYYFVGDSAFQLSKHVMRLYPMQNLNEDKAVFNYRLCRARRTIENTFGIFAARWQIFRKPIMFHPESAEKIIMAAVCLHNFLKSRNDELPVPQQMYCPSAFVDVEMPNGDMVQGEWRMFENNLRGVAQMGPHRATLAAYQQRNTLATYFVSPQGQVPWKIQHVQRGRNM